MRNNRGLQKWTRRKYIKSTTNSSSHKHTTRHATKLDEQKYKKSEEKRKLKILKSLIWIGSLTLIFLYFGYNYVDNEVPKYFEKYNLKKSKIIAETKAKKEKEAYNYWIDSGNRNLELKNYTQAYNDFLFARSIINHGKRANFGITICLLRDCKLDKVNCELSTEYYEKLIAEGNLTATELKNLNSFK